MSYIQYSILHVHKILIKYFSGCTQSALIYYADSGDIPKNCVGKNYLRNIYLIKIL